MNRKGFINDILRLVSVKSFTDDAEGIKRCQNVVIEMAESFGFEASLHGNGKVVVIQPKGLKGVPELGLVVHLDTVSFDEKGWKHNPLGEVSDGRIYGRGVLDDKCAIVQSLYAFKALEQKIQPSWQIIVGSSEEGEWVDMQEFLKENPVLPKTMVTVDGDGVQNGCRGYLDLEFTFERAIKTKNLIELEVPNGVNNTVPAKAFAQTQDGAWTSKGTAVHSSIPEMGKNALVVLSETLGNFSEIRAEFPKYFELIKAVKDTSGEKLGFAANTSVCPTKCCLEDDMLVVNLNVRLGETTKKDDLLRVLINLKKKFDCRLIARELTMPAFVPENSREIRLMCQAYEQVMGMPIAPTVAKGVGYNAALPNCSIFGPRFAPEDDEPDTCHSADENRSIADLLKFQKMLEKFVESFLAN